MRIFPVICSMMVFAGCATASEDAASDSAAETVATKIEFNDRFEQTITSGELLPGRTVQIDYDVDRLTTCRGEQAGIPQWTITGFYKINGGPVHTFPAGGLGLRSASSEIELDHAGDLEIWFQNTNRWGCNSYDSNQSANYHFTIAEAQSSTGG